MQVLLIAAMAGAATAALVVTIWFFPLGLWENLRAKEDQWARPATEPSQPVGVRAKAAQPSTLAPAHNRRISDEIRLCFIVAWGGGLLIAALIALLMNLP